MPLFFLTSNDQFASLSMSNTDEHAGGHVVFRGSVRDVNHQQQVDHLFYEAHQKLALSMWDALEKYVREQFQVLHCVGCHRLGRVEVSHDAVFIMASAAHRHEAFLAVRFLIDELKRSLPIWKKEVYKKGTWSWHL